MYNFTNLILLIALLNYVSLIYAENESYIVAIRRKETDKVYNNESPEIQKKIDILVNDRMNDIYDIIEENKDTYILENGEMDEKLEELDNSIQLKKRSNKNKIKLFFIDKNRPYKNNELIKRSLESNNSTVEYIPFESNLVNQICPIANYYAIKVYLSKETLKIVCNLENVIYCEKDEITEEPEISEISDIPEIITSENGNKNDNKEKSINKRDNNSSLYYNINEIKKETKWSNVNVQSISYTPNHLALISQSPYIDMNKSFDTNFYYPSSAGKGIDIYIIDRGIIVNHEDFDTSERTITCDAIVNEGIIHTTTKDEKIKCTGTSLSHGIKVTSLAGGKIYGVAKKANLHMIMRDGYDSTDLASLDYIKNNAKPYKTVINISFGGDNDYSKPKDDKLSELINEGFIIIVSAGNNNKNCCERKDSDEFRNYSGYRKAISVGGVTSNIYGDGYYRADNSNYGDCIDIFAPYNVITADPENGFKASKKSSGTSYSSPLIAGVAASIMSEHPEIKYDNQLMRETLIEMSIKDAIHNIGSSDTPNRFINNGKRSIYTPTEKTLQCGSKVNQKCSNGCCGKDGYCHSYTNTPLEVCLTENGCQSNSGFCTSSEKVIKECEKELENNKECLLDISSNMNVENRINRCKNLKSNECEVFLRKLVNNLSVCSIAKKYKSFDLIKSYDKKKYYATLDICENNSYIKYKNECKTQIENNKEYLIDESINFNDYSTFSANVERCTIIKSNKFVSFYNNKIQDTLKNYLPSCYFFYHYHEVDLIKELTNYNAFSNNDKSIQVYNEYIKFCNGNIQNKSVEMCNKILEENKECQITKNGNNNNNNNNNYNCNIFKSEKCQSFYQIYNNPGFVCKVAQKYKTTNHDQKWSLWDENPYNIMNAKTRTVWIYNPKLNKCIESGEKYGDKPTIINCNSAKKTQWQIPISGNGFFKSLYEGNEYCLTVDNIDEGDIIMKECNENSIIMDINSSYNGKSIISSLNKNKCLGLVNTEDYDLRLKLNKCNESSEDQQWEIWFQNPNTYQTVWIYNKNIDKCINSDIEYGYRPTIGVCQNKSFSQWKIPKSGDGFFKSIYNDLCLNLCNPNTGTVVMGNCDNNSIIKNISNSYNKESVTSNLYNNKCLGSYNINNLKENRLHFNTCDKNRYDQHWEIRTTNPGEIRCVYFKVTH
ncbi:hypothetical protein BCR32DRAFT_301338 [Anaeromyces robustus]|uniref:Ricin B lectin domain-containing protein n=1 Tax=Anaeromyces robustus TaxID=1754192 RepID=A0A1Y1X0P5_9FUNG|nr:hypothetical protein BCR32DRAFT_301338 [Anaeromyces robustus]|eukprot:ORX78904.1 hypothetical protein BCR32DRAFT_301338 [Anaeromyces robustus]